MLSLLMGDIQQRWSDHTLVLNHGCSFLRFWLDLRILCLSFLDILLSDFFIQSFSSVLLFHQFFLFKFFLDLVCLQNADSLFPLIRLKFVMIESCESIWRERKFDTTHDLIYGLFRFRVFGDRSCLRQRRSFLNELFLQWCYSNSSLKQIFCLIR